MKNKTIILTILWLLVIIFFINNYLSDDGLKNQAAGRSVTGKQIPPEFKTKNDESHIDVNDPEINEILTKNYQKNSIESIVNNGLNSSNVDKQVATLVMLYDYLYQNINEDRYFISENSSHMSTLRGFAESSEYKYGLLGLSILNLIYKVEDKLQTEYLIANARNNIGPYKSQILVKIFIEREHYHPALVREFWHEVILRGQSEDIVGPLEAALELSKINTEGRLKYLEDILKLMETDHYIGTVTLLTAISNYGQSALPYLTRLEAIRERMIPLYDKVYEESYLSHIDLIISNLKK